MCTLRTLMFGALAITILSSIAIAKSPYTFTPIANLSDYAGYFEPATINNRGDVWFAPAMKTGGEGVLLWSHGALTTITKGGQPAPGGGIFDATYSPVQMNDNGDVAFVMGRDYGNEPPVLGLDAGVYGYTSRTGIVPVMLPGTPVPGGGQFWGAWFGVNVNNGGDVYFSGIVCTTATVSFLTTQACPDGSSGVLSFGLYKADRRGHITPIVKPGDAAPGGSYFDFAQTLASNERGDVAFQAHIFSDWCDTPFLFYCTYSLFFKSGQSGRIVPIARFGDPSPVPGKNYSGAGGSGSYMVNAAGDVAFPADTSRTGDTSEQSVFLYTRGRTIVIARPGDPLPGGGNAAVMGLTDQDIAINNGGAIVFDVTLADGTQGIYLWRQGRLSLVAKTGTQTPAGVISDFDDFGIGLASSQVWINDAGQILFAAHFQGGGGAMLIATPH